MLEVCKRKYEELFQTDSEKAKAFDKLAELYYSQNFGATSKADLDLLMFSLLLEQILDRSEADPETYSDYTLSKLLGVSQSRISSLKEKKQLKYPYDGFDWRKSFLRMCHKVRVIDGNVLVAVYDKNLYLELQHAIEQNDGFVEVQLTRNLLKTPIGCYLDLVMEVSGEEDRNVLLKELKKAAKSQSADVEFFERPTFREFAGKFGHGLLLQVVENLPIPGSGEIAKIVGSLLSAIESGRK